MMRGARAYVFVIVHLTREMQLILGFAVIVINTAAYGSSFWRHLRRS